MEKPDPQKRKSIHDREIPIDEMRDNDKNSAKMKLIQERDHGKLDSSDEDIVTSDEEDERETSPIINKEHTRIYKKDKLTEITRIKIKKSPERQANDTCTINADNLTFKRNISSPPKYSPETSRPRRTSKPSVKNDNNGYSIYTIGIVAIGIVLLVYFGYLSPSNSNTNSINSAKDNSENSPLSTAKLRIKSIRSKYKNQEKKLWDSAYNSIREIINKPKTPSIILLLGNTSDPLSCLATVLGDISGKALDSHRVFLSPDKFDSDVGSVIENLRLKLQKNKAVVIWDLLNINVEALRAFHNLCDRINPLVKEVIFIITVIADNYDKKSNPLEFIEKELFKKLSGKIKDDDIQPLITRITDGPILIVKPEPTVTDCPSIT